MFFDRSDILEAHKAFYEAYQRMSPRFVKRLARINRRTNPNLAWFGFAGLTDNGRAIYEQLDDKHFGGDDQ